MGESSQRERKPVTGNDWTRVHGHVPQRDPLINPRYGPDPKIRTPILYKN